MRVANRMSWLAESLMRVIAGQYRSRPLRSLPGLDIRPTSDRLRETLFDVLTAGDPSALEGSIWIDLYAGTGAVGIEALSRGAVMVYFVEAARSAADLIRDNLKSLEVASGYEILNKDARRGGRLLQERGVVADFVFLDPPYRMEDECEKTLELLARSAILRNGGVAIAEHLKKFSLQAEVGKLQRYRLLEQGDAALSFYRKLV